MTAFPRRVLVTGAAGFLGRAVTSHLRARADVDLVVATDRIGTAQGDGKSRWVKRDIRDSLRDLMQEHEIQAIVHHAFLVRPHRNEQTARQINVEATAQLVEDAVTAGVTRLAYPSSTTVYGPWPDSRLHTEDEPPRPIPGFQYSQHKLAAERTLLAGASEDLTAVVLRSCVILGQGADNFISRSLGLPVMPVPAGANPEMQFIHIDDYLTALEHALTAPRSGTYNIAGIGTVPFRQLVRLAGSRVISIPEPLLRRVTDMSWRLRLQNRSPGTGIAFIRHPWLASTSLIEAEFGWRATYSSFEAVRAWVGRD